MIDSFKLYNRPRNLMYYFVMLLVLFFDRICYWGIQWVFSKLHYGFTIVSEVVFIKLSLGKQRLCTLAQNCK